VLCYSCSLQLDAKIAASAYPVASIIPIKRRHRVKTQTDGLLDLADLQLPQGSLLALGLLDLKRNHYPPEVRIPELTMARPLWTREGIAYKSRPRHR